MVRETTDSIVIPVVVLLMTLVHTFYVPHSIIIRWVPGKIVVARQRLAEYWKVCFFQTLEITLLSQHSDTSPINASSPHGTRMTLDPPPG